MSKQRDDVTGYTLTRAWFNFSFENPDLVSPTHTAMYLWFVELNNRMGWSKKFAAPASYTMSAIGLKSYNTYKKIFDDLVKFGVVKLVKSSKNQYTACVIALSNFDKALDKALDKAVIELITTHSESTEQSIDSIIKPQTLNLKPQTIVVVEYEKVFSFFLTTRNKRVLKEQHHIDDFKIEIFFKRFYDEKIDIGELNNKSESDIVKHFSMWLPKIILSEKNNTQKNGSAPHKSNAQSIIDNATNYLEKKYGPKN